MSFAELEKGRWVIEDWQGQTRFALNVLSWLHDEQSAYQRIQVVDTEVYGRVLVLDGIFQTSERDEHFYHEMLVQPAMCIAPNIEQVLVIGGGDGGTAREVLRHKSVKKLVMVEIDERVVRVARQFLPDICTSFSDPRLQLRFEDGVRYVHDAPPACFDVIVLDGSDPVGPSTGLFDVDFYRHCRRLLKPNGVLALQSESFFQTERLWHAIQSTLQQVFGAVHPCFGIAPLYSTGTWSWTLCAQTLDPLAIIDERAAAIEAQMRYYNRDIHRSAFTLPNSLRL